VTAIVNTGDDIELHGLHVSPDLDTVTYTLAGAVNPDTGWGLVNETWHAMANLERYGGDAWFRLGDRDLGTHLFRTARLAEGATLSDLTAEIAAAWGLELAIVPVTNDRLRTRITLDDGEVSFQEYFVHRQHAVPVHSVRFDGAEQARPAPGVLRAIDEASVVVVAPSNPIVSIGPILAVPGVREALVRARERVVAISPLVAGRALKGPADRLLRELGHEASVEGVASLYADVAAALVIDEADAALAATVDATGTRCVVAPTIMHTAEVAATLARLVLDVVMDDD
jgi:LPPG:FO 2-phospho-L-lactate transferase